MRARQEAPPPPLSSSRKKKGRVGKNAASPATTAPQVTEVGQGTAELYQLVAPYGPNLEWSMPLQLSGDFQKGAFARNQLLKSACSASPKTRSYIRIRLLDGLLACSLVRPLKNLRYHLNIRSRETLKNPLEAHIFL